MTAVEALRPDARALAGQLIRSHLLVAAIGIGLMMVALAVVVLLRAETIRIAQRHAPLEQAASQLLNGVEESVAALRGWVSLGDERFLSKWSSAWSTQIEAALESLVALGEPMAELGGESQLNRVLPLLEELKESQWWIRSVAHTPGNRPAEVIIRLEVEPVAETLDTIFDALLRAAVEYPVNAGHDALLQVASSQSAFARARLLLEKMVFDGEGFHEAEFRQQLRLVSTSIRRILPPAGASHLISLSIREVDAFSRLADEAIELRKSAHWNTAQYLMETETAPLADDVVRSARLLSARAARLMDAHTRRAERISTIATWGLMALIAGMLVLAAGIARRRSYALSRPITRLVDATRAFAAGRLEQDVEASSIAELETLSRAFNSMRRRLLQSQEELVDINATLEQRVQARTADLTEINARLQDSEQRFRATFEQAAVGILHANTEGRLLRVNQRFCDIVGYSREEMLTLRLRDITHPEDLDADTEQVRRALTREIKTFSVEKRHHCKSRDIVWVNLTMSLALDKHGRPDYFIGVVEDITARKQADQRLLQAATVFESTAEGVVVTDAEKNILSVNRAFTEITGYTEDEVRGQNPRLLQSGRQDEGFYQQMWADIEATGHWRGEIWNRRKNGDIYPEWLTISVVDDGHGRVRNFVGVFADITAVKHSQAKLEHLAHHDPLTGLPNRLLFHDRLSHALERARRRKYRVAVLFLDLDRFKNVNDSLGHPVGDQLLKDVAERVTASVREEDTVARLGGDEFAVSLEDIRHEEDLAAVAGKIIRAMAEPFELVGRGTIITTSIGIALYPTDGPDVITLLQNADAAMYVAKEEGRNTYRFYRAEMTRTVLNRLTLEAALRRALDREELEVWYQPQIDLRSGRTTGAEALVRWRDPQRGLISPAQFIPLAEETGLVIPLGEWVLQTACAQTTAWRALGLSIDKIAVNVAGPQIDRGDFVLTVRRVLERTGLPSEALELELTESFIMREADHALKIMQGLKELGVSAAIDDFGTGYSSLSYLKRLPIDRLKIDQSFVRDLPGDADDAAITRAVIALGHSLGYGVIAEGVENDSQKAFLEQAGCYQVQGFLYSPPVPSDSFEKWLRA